MLESFRSEIPNINKLVEEIRRMLSSTPTSLEEITEQIFDHIVGESDFEINEEKKERTAMLTATNATADIIDELEVNDTNFRRLKEYIKSYDDYNAFNRVIANFEGYMPASERRTIIERGKKLFAKELTEYW